MKNRESLWLASFVVSLVVVTLAISLLRLQDSHSGAADAKSNLNRVAQLLGQIERLHGIQTQVQVAEPKSKSTKVWVEYAKGAQIPESSLKSIEPLPPQKISESDYQREDVFIEIDGVSAQQAASFLVRCESSAGGYRATSIHLSKAAGNAETDRWNADLVLSRLAFDAAK